MDEVIYKLFWKNLRDVLTEIYRDKDTFDDKTRQGIEIFFKNFNNKLKLKRKSH